MSLRAHEFDRVVGKFGMKTRDSYDLLAWFEHEGKVVTRTRRSKGKGELPAAHLIRQQLKLTEAEMQEAIACTLKKEGYVEILRRKGVL